MGILKKENASFKDPTASVYTDVTTGKHYRIFSQQAAAVFQSFINSDIYKELQHLFPSIRIIEDSNDLKIEVETIPYQNYFYEWTFDMLKDAAVFYLDIQKKLVEHGFILIDATPTNLTFTASNKICYFDLGSINKFDPSIGWLGFRQFIELFVYPLYVYSSKYCSADTLQYFINNRLEPGFIKRFVPGRYRFNFYYNAIQNIYKRFRQGNKQEKAAKQIDVKKMQQTFVFLEAVVKNINKKRRPTNWSVYYSESILQGQYSNDKEKFFKEFLNKIKIQGELIIDWGANTGKYSEIISKTYPLATVLSVDSDETVVNALYKRKDNNILPLVINQLKPSAGLGWMNKEYRSFATRFEGKAGLQTALALIHHLQHFLNLPFNEIAAYFNSFSTKDGYLIIEYINDEDMNLNIIKNPNYPHDHTEKAFADSFSEYFDIVDRRIVCNTRILFLMKKKANA